MTLQLSLQLPLSLGVFLNLFLLLILILASMGLRRSFEGASKGLGLGMPSALITRAPRILVVDVYGHMADTASHRTSCKTAYGL
jgi:hypothetical protein